ncbi:hypothetical protein MNBD_NITROSPINAE01-1810 [hydrothermal vent metagenome]|uniref:SHSP domain-containing protein n=1 Tax=hydrothermal vent metagenome TaxID=652676 RepID=A0A3B1BXE9_9ZZZZ
MSPERRKKSNLHDFAIIDQVMSQSGSISAQTDVLGESRFVQIDVYETPDSIVVEFDLPGMSIDDIKVNVQKEWLIVDGMKKESVHDEKVNYLCMERDFGSIRRRLKIPGVIDPNAVTAKYINGVLEIKLPTRVDRRKSARKIQINGSEG